jgi:hypothetical protein
MMFLSQMQWKEHDVFLMYSRHNLLLPVNSINLQNVAMHQPRVNDGRLVGMTERLSCQVANL